MSGENIESASIGGDFFGNEPVAYIEELLSGSGREEVKSRLAGVAVDRYIFGMTENELAELVDGAFEK